MTEAHDPLIGVTVTGSYVIRTKLAEGGMGAVYVAVNQLGNRKVVKFLLAEFNQSPTIRERFDREARAAARLKGKPHIVEIDDVGTLPNGQQFMTMEFLHGKPLDLHLRQIRRASPHDAFHIVVQIGRGLHELHAAGVIHRDLKPGNVFLRNDEDDPHHVVLIDLGIAHDSVAIQRDGYARTQSGMAVGTPGYMSPEQFDDAGSVTPAADIYALAAILWEMLCGTPPWGFADSRVLYFKQRTEQPEFPPGVVMPDEWRNILLGALAPLPRHRPQTVYGFIAALASALPPDESLGIPGGAQMMSLFAKSMLKKATPDSETVRAPGAPRLAPMLWAPDSSASASGPASVNLSGVPAPLAAPRDPHTPRLPSTVDARPGAGPIPMSPPTTLSASSGVSEHPQSRPTSRWGVLVGAVGLFAVAGIAIGIAMRGGSANSEATKTPTPTVAPLASGGGASPLDATPVSPADAAAAIDGQAASTVRSLETPEPANGGAQTVAEPTVTTQSPTDIAKPREAAKPKAKAKSKSKTSNSAPTPPTSTFDPNGVEE